MMMRMGSHLKSHTQALMLHFTISSPDRFHRTNHYRLNSRWAFIIWQRKQTLWKINKKRKQFCFLLFLFVFHETRFVVVIAAVNTDVVCYCMFVLWFYLMALIHSFNVVHFIRRLDKNKILSSLPFPSSVNITIYLQCINNERQTATDGKRLRWIQNDKTKWSNSIQIPNTVKIHYVSHPMRVSTASHCIKAKALPRNSFRFHILCCTWVWCYKFACSFLLFLHRSQLLLLFLHSQTSHKSSEAQESQKTNSKLNAHFCVL